MLKLKEQLGEGEYREEVRTLLARLKKRDDLYARIGAEIDVLLASNVKVPKSSPSLARGGASTPASPIASVSPAPREKPSSNIAADAGTATPHSTWRLVLRGLLALICGFGATNGTMEALGFGHREVGFLLWFIWAVIVWFLLPFLVLFLRHKI